MVIHDLRNPTSQINFGIGFALEILNTALKQQLDKVFTNQKNCLMEIIADRTKDLVRTFEELQAEIQNLKEVNLQQREKLQIYEQESLQKQIQIDLLKAKVEIQEHQILEQNMQRNWSDGDQKSVIENYIEQLKQKKVQNDQLKMNSFDSFISDYQDISEECDDAGSDQKQSQPMKQQLKEQYGILFTGISPININKKQNPGKLFKKQNQDSFSKFDNNYQNKKYNNSIKTKQETQFFEDQFQQKNKNNSQNIDNLTQGPNEIQQFERNHKNLHKKKSSISDFTFNNYNLHQAVAPQIIQGSENSSQSADMNSFEDSTKQKNENVREILNEFQLQLKGQIQSYSHQLQIEEAIEIIQGCRHSSSMLLNLLNDLLDLAKQEKLTFQLNKSYFNLMETIQASFKILEFLSMKKQVRLILKISPNQEKFFENIYGDEKRYEQILLNFLSNALKFSPSESKVEVVLKIQNVFSSQKDKEMIQNQKWQNSEIKKEIMQIIDEHQEVQDETQLSTSSHYDLNFGPSLLKKNNLLRTPSISQEIGNRQNLFFIKFSLKIIDSGQGISEEGLKNLFQDFSSLKEHSHINQRGTGLGLSICKKIINKMGGTVHVKSQKDKGTTFKIEITTLSQVFGDEYEIISENSMSGHSELSKSLNQQSIEQKYQSSNKNNLLNSKSDKSKRSSLMNSTISNQIKSDEINDEVSNSSDPRNTQNNSSIKKNIKKNKSSSRSLDYLSLDEVGNNNKFKNDKQQKQNYRKQNLEQVQENPSNFGNQSNSSESLSEQIEPTKQNNNQTTIQSRKHSSSTFNELQNQKQPSKDTGSFNRIDSDLNYSVSLFQQKSQEELIKHSNKIQENSENISSKSPQSCKNITMKIDQQLYQFTEPSSEMKLKDGSESVSNKSNHCQGSNLKIENALSFGELQQSPNKQSTITLCNQSEQIMEQNPEKTQADEQLKPEPYQNNQKYIDGLYQNMVDYCFLEIERQKKWTSDLKLLLANDDQMTLTILIKIFTTKIGFSPSNIDQAYDGLDAQKKAQIKQYDLIVMDLNMPVMDGFTATKNIKNFYSKNSQQIFATSIILQNQKSPYIIALSGSQPDQQLLNLCQESGFDDYFTQPLTVDDIFQKILSKIYYIHQIIANDQIARIEQEKAMKAQQSQRKIENKGSIVSVPSIKQILSKRFDVIEEEASEDEEQSHNPLFIKQNH